MPNEDKIDGNKLFGYTKIFIVNEGKPKRGQPIVEAFITNDIHNDMKKIEEVLKTKYPYSIGAKKLELVQNNSTTPEQKLYCELVTDIQYSIMKLENLISDSGVTLPDNELDRLILSLGSPALEGFTSYYLHLLSLLTITLEKIKNNRDNTIALELAQEMLCIGKLQTQIFQVFPHADATKKGYNQGRKNDVTEELILEFDKQYRERIKNGDSEKAAKTYAAKYCQGKWRETNLDIESNPKGKAPSNDTFIKAWKRSAKDK